MNYYLLGSDVIGAEVQVPKGLPLAAPIPQPPPPPPVIDLGKTARYEISVLVPAIGLLLLYRYLWKRR